MSMPPDSTEQTIHSKHLANTLILISLGVGALFLAHYIGIFALAALTTVLFDPIYQWFKRRRYIGRIAVALTFVTICALLVVPLFFVLSLAFNEASQLAKALQSGEINLNTILKDVNQTASSIGITIPVGSIKEAIRHAIPEFIGFIFTTTGNIFGFLSDAIVYFMVLAFLLVRGKNLVQAIARVSPFRDDIDREYLAEIHSLATSMVRGTFIIAVVISAISCFTLWIIGFNNLFLWFVIFTLFSLIPLGSGIIYMPIGIILLLTGSVWQGLFILAVQVVVLNNIDGILRQRLTPKSSKMPGVLIVVSSFAGIAYFGIVGVVYGPIIMGLIYASVDIYDRYLDKGIPLKRTLA
jgi:predicted PurR-regulated permease PerM